MGSMDASSIELMGSMEDDSASHASASGEEGDQDFRDEEDHDFGDEEGAPGLCHTSQCCGWPAVHMKF